MLWSWCRVMWLTYTVRRFDLNYPGKGDRGGVFPPAALASAIIKAHWCKIRYSAIKLLLKTAPGYVYCFTPPSRFGIELTFGAELNLLGPAALRWRREARQNTNIPTKTASYPYYMSNSKSRRKYIHTCCFKLITKCKYRHNRVL